MNEPGDLNPIKTPVPLPSQKSMVEVVSVVKGLLKDPTDQTRPH